MDARRIGRGLLCAALCLLALNPCARAQHDHGAPEKLGQVSFRVSCVRATQASFNHAVALLHSFAYTAAEKEFRALAERDPQCAMAHWGVAMSYYRQLWEPKIFPEGLEKGAAEIQKAQSLAAQHADEREQAFIAGLATFYAVAARTTVVGASLAYTNAMRDVATQNPDDVESQIFYALAFLSIAPASDAVHTNQRMAAQILQPLFADHPNHPGLAHYLIHAYDSPELAGQGLKAARAYAKVAPSAPHALHMPSHIFTLLGMWNDSIGSNRAARSAAHEQGDVGEELHAMDYLMYAYLQTGRTADAEKLLADLREMKGLDLSEYKIAYAAALMPVRFAVEQQQWGDAMKIPVAAESAPQFRAATEWANALGAARSGNATEAELHLDNLKELLEQVRKSGDEHWASQVEIQVGSAAGWLAHAKGNEDEAIQLLRAAADEEDRMAKRPITPGPAIPAREQLADLLRETHHENEAAAEYARVLKSSPGRKNAMAGAASASAAK